MVTAADGLVTRTYRTAYTPEDGSWHVLDPLGGAICCAATEARADEVVRWLTVAAREREADDGACC